MRERQHYSNISPICLFAYARPEHTRRTLEALVANRLADQSDLIVYADAAHSSKEEVLVNEVRALVRGAQGFRTVSVIEREINYGLVRNIIEGVTAVCRKYGRVIVLEDDLVTSTHFLTYMNEALDLYADDERVASIHGWCFPTERCLPEAFFLPGADCWGWATWRRGWALFKSDGEFLLNEIKRRQMTRSFDLNGAYPFTRMLEDQIRGRNDSWAIRLHASVFLEGKLSLYPGRTLVHNIGNDSSGVHCGKTSAFDSQLSHTPIDLSQVTVELSEVGLIAYKDFFRKIFSFWNRLRRKVFRNAE